MAHAMNHVISSGALRVEVEPDGGRIAAIRNLERELDLIAVERAVPPFRIELADGATVESFDAFNCHAIADGLRLAWEAPQALTLTCDVHARGDDIIFEAALANAGRATIERLEYPIIAGIGRLAGAGGDELVHTHAGGMLFHDPIDLFEADPDNRRRLRFSVYPEGFSGSTMQFLAYYGKGKGGFLLGTEDAQKALKAYSVEHEGGTLTASVMHKASRPVAGADLRPGYPVVLAALEQGSWHAAADRYRSWALEQPWAVAGQRSSWLREQVGICTFGINARHDRSAWLDEIHRMAGTPVFHVLGPNWAHWGHDYRNNLPRRRDDWFPAVFAPANLAAIRRNGDYWAPFEFDLLAGHAPEFDEPILASRMVHDQRERSLSDPNAVRFPFMCAGAEYWRDFHVERDERLVAEHDPDALYYDISVSNLMLQCLADGHRHAPGAGTEIAELFTAMYRDTSLAMAAAAGEHVPAGTEVISEIFLDTFEYYQARAQAGPYAPFEAAVFRDWVLDGRAETIPLFTYVFGERAPLRMDGWAKLSAGAGDLFYWTAAQIVLNGGLFQLNYEFSALEDLDGRTDPPAEHYYDFDERHYAIDRAKAAFVGEVSRTRVGPAGRFLARGRMLPAPPVDAPPVTLAYHSYNIGKADPLYDTRGQMTVRSALATAWQHDGDAMWLVANLLPDAQEVRVDDRPLVLRGRQIAVVPQ